ncbi:CD1375 family protein [Peribacillus sp. NPDC097206]
MYVRLVQANRRTIESVPDEFRTEVKTIIEGGNTNG